MNARQPLSRTTYGRLRVVRAVVLVSIVALGLVTGAVVYSASQTANDVATNTGLAVAAARQVRADLVEGNEAVIGSFLSDASVLTGQGYQDGIIGSNRVLNELAEYHAADPEASRQVRTLDARLVIYTSLLARADTSYRLTNLADPAYRNQTVTYLSIATDLMHDPDQGILPLVESLGAPATDDLAGQESIWSLRPVGIALPIVGAVAVLALLVWAQMFLHRRFRRVLNPGLLVASVAVVALVAWATVVLVDNAGDYEAAFDAHTSATDDWQAQADESTVELRDSLNGVSDTRCGSDLCRNRVLTALDDVAEVSPETEAPAASPNLTAFTADIDAATDLNGLQFGVPVLTIAIAALALLGFKPRVDEYRVLRG